MNKLEIACFNLESALIAQKNGANRIELCVDKNSGGVTPPIEMIKTARKQIKIDLFVMIRPRGGNFVYSDSEFQTMKKDLLTCKNLGADGFVFGILNKNHTLNIAQNTELIKLAHPLPCTFHKAFDVSTNYLKNLKNCIKCGFKTILTSGHKTDINQGISVLFDLKQKATNSIEIMPGGGIRSSNILSLHSKLGNSFYHSSGITNNGEIANANEIELMSHQLSIINTKFLNKNPM